MPFTSKRSWTLAVCAVVLVALAGLIAIAALELATEAADAATRTWVGRTQLVLMAMTVLAIAFAAALALEAKEALARHARDNREAVDLATRALATRQDLFAMLRETVEPALHIIARNAEQLMAQRGREGDLQVARIQNAASEIERAVWALIEAANVAAGRPRLHRQWVDSRELLAAALDRCRPLVDAKAVRLQLHVNPQPTSLHVDRERVVEVLAHLAADALDRAPIGGRVAIHLDRFGPFARFDFTDHHASAPLPDPPPVCRRIVEAHGGQLGADRNGAQRSRWCVLPAT